MNTQSTKCDRYSGCYICVDLWWTVCGMNVGITCRYALSRGLEDTYAHRHWPVQYKNPNVFFVSLYKRGRKQR